jgi:hypothetical protein
MHQAKGIMCIILDSILLFPDKEHLLISQRYQLHLASATTHYPSCITDAHNQKKEPRYSDLFLVTTTINTIKTAPEIQLLHKKCLQTRNRV